MNNLPEEIILHILNNLKNTIDVINFSLSNKFYRNLVLKNKESFNCIIKLNDKFINELDKLIIIGKIKLEIKYKNIINVSMIKNFKEV